jgi:hypothetical protein
LDDDPDPDPDANPNFTRVGKKIDFYSQPCQFYLSGQWYNTSAINFSIFDITLKFSGKFNILILHLVEMDSSPTVS